MSGKSTKKGKLPRDTLRADYRREDLGPGVRGQYLERFKAGTNLVLIEPDIAAAFPTAAAVNAALRSLLRLARRAARN